MAIEVVCHVCQRKMAAPDELAGREGTCPWCKSVVSISVPGLVPIDYGLQSVPAEQWYVTLPDGRQLGPATEEQFQAAQARGALPPTALVRRGDWPQAMSFSEWQSWLSAQAREQAEAKRLPYGTYSQQLSSNPVGTLLFGPQMPKHQANRDSQVRTSRRRHFYAWLGVLGAYLLGAMILPTLGALICGDRSLLIAAPFGGLFLAFWPTIFFLIGMLMYSGALFEWSWFFNSRRMRAMRAWGGEGYARGFYLWVGGILMGGSAAASFGVTFLVTLTMLSSGRPAGQQRRPLAAQPVVPQPFAGQPNANRPGNPPPPPPASERFVQAAREADRARNALDNAERELTSQLDRVTRAQENLRQNLQNVSARANAASEDENALREAADFESKRAAWQKAHENLVAVQKSEKKTPVMIAQLKELAPNYSVILASIHERSKNPFPHQEVSNLERDLETLNRQFHGMSQAAARIGGKQIMSASIGVPSQMRSGTAEEFLHELATLMQPKLDRLSAIEVQWNYRSRFLLDETPKLRIDAALAGKAPEAMRPPGFPSAFPPVGAPPPVPVNNPGPLDPSLFQLELQFKIYRNFFLAQRDTYANAKSRWEEDRKNPNLPLTSLSAHEALLKGIQKRLDEKRAEMLTRRTALEEFCRREGKKSALLDEPIPE